MTQCQKTLMQKNFDKISTKISSPKVLLMSYFEAFNFFFLTFSLNQFIYCFLKYPYGLHLFFISSYSFFQFFNYIFYINPFFFSKILKTSLQTSSLMNQKRKMSTLPNNFQVSLYMARKVQPAIAILDPTKQGPTCTVSNPLSTVISTL